MASVLNTEAAVTASTAMSSISEDDLYVAPKRVEVKKTPVRVQAATEDEDEDAMAYFKKIATED